ncbi:hypothetical protein PVAP13_4KG103740 [Panicum virgatum]|uniref:Uncharacterized protein n=1 Tax=Panicum virgatum TaxID=38727 RepID=A0A8T0TSF2_PANVG|nr:hypothetical protein PVAP13_4KG103740 [Panicum virgatum]
MSRSAPSPASVRAVPAAVHAVLTADPRPAAAPDVADVVQLADQYKASHRRPTTTHPSTILGCLGYYDQI